ncbi:MAG: DUF1214 domain-containing protein [Methylocystis sp.]|nr:DUF1214 domain-containing protein [Methylocystis sp.]
MIAGLVLGFWTTALSLDQGRGFGSIRVGPWTAWPRNGTSEIDPYARAIAARSGETPLGRAQGLVFLAAQDSAGAQLYGRCEYHVVDPLPAARFWTLGLMREDGALIQNPTARHAYTSSDVLRRDDGGFEIVVAPQPRPGNWLSAGDATHFILVLRLYDTSLDTDATLDPATFPKITKSGCA